MIINTEQFSYDKQTKTFAGFASDGPLHELFRPGQGAPSLLTLQSQWTQQLLDVHLLSTNHDGEGDITSWTYGPESCKFTLQIFND